MTVLDWVLVVIWAGIALGGFFKGAVRIVFGFGGAALGIWLAVVVGPDLAISLTGTVNSEWMVLGLAYLIPFVVVTLLCLLAGWGMEKTLEGLKLGCLNRLLGAVLAGAAAAAVLAVLLVSAVRMSPELAAFEERSALLTRVQKVVGLALSEGVVDQPDAGDDPAHVEGGPDDQAAGDSNGR